MKSVQLMKMRVMPMVMGIAVICSTGVQASDALPGNFAARLGSGAVVEEGKSVYTAYENSGAFYTYGASAKALYNAMVEVPVDHVSAEGVKISTRKGSGDLFSCSRIAARGEKTEYACGVMLSDIRRGTIEKVGE